MTPLEAFQAATVVPVVPACALKLDGTVGTIEPGKRADRILVAGRPDRRISEIRKVKTAIPRGQACECGELWKSVGVRP
jgi:imidazolonepropionase-like amidohydrolase